MLFAKPAKVYLYAQNSLQVVELELHRVLLVASHDLDDLHRQFTKHSVKQA